MQQACLANTAVNETGAKTIGNTPSGEDGGGRPTCDLSLPNGLRAVLTGSIANLPLVRGDIQ